MESQQKQIHLPYPRPKKRLESSTMTPLVGKIHNFVLRTKIISIQCERVSPRMNKLGFVFKKHYCVLAAGAH